MTVPKVAAVSPTMKKAYPKKFAATPVASPNVARFPKRAV